MQIKSVRTAVLSVAAGAAILGTPAVAGAAPVPLTPATQDTTESEAAPVVALYDPQTGSSSISSGVTSRFVCLFQSVSAAGGLDCINGSN
ncbi:hypothetical protein [Nocardia sp. BMG111209]|uniref:hypothetical protein n=1 Tax=Nocardia sp. BMG111209 TaxID=1160137 RepID=UPI0003694F51|nr:hypothetical protein [Nocardia sp. BMG111209]